MRTIHVTSKLHCVEEALLVDVADSAEDSGALWTLVERLNEDSPSIVEYRQVSPLWQAHGYVAPVSLLFPNFHLLASLFIRPQLLLTIVLISLPATCSVNQTHR